MKKTVNGLTTEGLFYWLASNTGLQPSFITGSTHMCNKNTDDWVQSSRLVLFERSKHWGTTFRPGALYSTTCLFRVQPECDI